MFDFGVAAGGLAGGAGVWLWCRETLAGAGSVDGRSGATPAGRAKDPDPNRHRQTYKQTYIYPYRQTDRHTDSHIDMQTDIHTDRRLVMSG